MRLTLTFLVLAALLAFYGQTQSDKVRDRDNHNGQKSYQSLLDTIRNAHKKLSSKTKPARFNNTLLVLLILMSGDISTNPGPRTIKYPSGVCKKAVRWNQDAVKCDQCDTWYHITCMQMNPITYQYLANHSDTTWICCQCGMPSFSSSLFNTTLVDLPNYFTSLNFNSASPTPVNPPNPVHTSTPGGPNRTTKRTNETAFNRPLRILTINFQSCKNKVQEL